MKVEDEIKTYGGFCKRRKPEKEPLHDAYIQIAEALRENGLLVINEYEGVFSYTYEWRLKGVPYNGSARVNRKEKEERIKQKQKEFIQRKKQAKASTYDPENPECCIECKEAFINVDSSVTCAMTDETNYEPFDGVGKKCPKRGGQGND